MKYLRTKKEKDALRSYLIEHTIGEFGRAIGVAHVTAGRIAKTLGECNCRNVEASAKLKEVIAPYIAENNQAQKEEGGSDVFGCSKINSSGAIRHDVIVNLITENLPFLSEEQLLKVLQLTLNCSTAQ